MPAEAGSFFNFFEISDDPFDVSVVLWPLHILILISFLRLAQPLPMTFSLRLLIISWVTWLMMNLILRKRTVKMTMMTLKKLIWRNQGQKRRRMNDAATTIYLFIQFWDNLLLCCQACALLAYPTLVDVVTVVLLIQPLCSSLSIILLSLAASFKFEPLIRSLIWN